MRNWNITFWNIIFQRITDMRETFHVIIHNKDIYIHTVSIINNVSNSANLGFQLTNQTSLLISSAIPPPAVTTPVSPVCPLLDPFVSNVNRRNKYSFGHSHFLFVHCILMSVCPSCVCVCVFRSMLSSIWWVH